MNQKAADLQLSLPEEKGEERKLFSARMRCFGLSFGEGGVPLVRTGSLSLAGSAEGECPSIDRRVRLWRRLSSSLYVCPKEGRVPVWSEEYTRGPLQSRDEKICQCCESLRPGFPCFLRIRCRLKPM